MSKTICPPKLFTIWNPVVSMFDWAANPSLKGVVSKGNKSLAPGVSWLFITAAFKSDIKPALAVSHYISKALSVGAVS